MGHTNYYILVVTREAFEIFRKYVKENNLQIVPKDPWCCDTLHIFDQDDFISIETNIRDYDREEAIEKAIRYVIDNCEESEYFTGSAYEGNGDGECKGKLYIWDKYEGTGAEDCNVSRDLCGNYNYYCRRSLSLCSGKKMLQNPLD